MKSRAQGLSIAPPSNAACGQFSSPPWALRTTRASKKGSSKEAKRQRGWGKEEDREPNDLFYSILVLLALIFVPFHSPLERGFLRNPPPSTTLSPPAIRGSVNRALASSACQVLAPLTSSCALEILSVSE